LVIDCVNIPDLAAVKTGLTGKGKLTHKPNLVRVEKPANMGVFKISTIYPFPLKIKFLDKLYNAYFSAKFQNQNSPL